MPTNAQFYGTSYLTSERARIESAMARARAEAESYVAYQNKLYEMYQEQSLKYSVALDDYDKQTAEIVKLMRNNGMSSDEAARALNAATTQVVNAAGDVASQKTAEEKANIDRGKFELEKRKALTELTSGSSDYTKATTSTAVAIGTGAPITTWDDAKDRIGGTLADQGTMANVNGMSPLERAKYVRDYGNQVQARSNGAVTAEQVAGVLAPQLGLLPEDVTESAIATEETRLRQAIESATPGTDLGTISAVGVAKQNLEEVRGLVGGAGAAGVADKAAEAVMANPLWEKLTPLLQDGRLSDAERKAFVEGNEEAESFLEDYEAAKDSYSLSGSQLGMNQARYFDEMLLSRLSGRSTLEQKKLAAEEGVAKGPTAPPTETEILARQHQLLAMNAPVPLTKRGKARADAARKEAVSQGNFEEIRERSKEAAMSPREKAITNYLSNAYRMLRSGEAPEAEALSKAQELWDRTERDGHAGTFKMSEIIATAEALYPDDAAKRDGLIQAYMFLNVKDSMGKVGAPGSKPPPSGGNGDDEDDVPLPPSGDDEDDVPPPPPKPKKPEDPIVEFDKGKTKRFNDKLDEFNEQIKTGREARRDVREELKDFYDSPKPELTEAEILANELAGVPEGMTAKEWELLQKKDYIKAALIAARRKKRELTWSSPEASPPGKNPAFVAGT